jgi:hypothetical protein
MSRFLQLLTTNSFIFRFVEMAQYDTIAKPWEVTTSTFWWTKISIPNHQALFGEIKSKQVYSYQQMFNLKKTEKKLICSI